MTDHQIDGGYGYTDGTATQVVMTSAGRIYLVTKRFDSYPWGDDVDGKQYPMRVYRADQTGIPSSFTLKDNAHAPAAPQSWAIALGTSDVIHILWVERSSNLNASNLKYCQFDTSTDTYGSVATIDSALGIDNENGQGDDLCAMAVDSNGEPHIVYCKNDGTRRRMNYRNHVGGSWSDAAVIDDQSFGAGQFVHHPGIVFDQNGRIVASWIRGSGEASSDGRAFVIVNDGSWGSGHDISGANMWPGIDTALRIYVDSNNRYHTAFLSTSKYIRYYYSDNLGVSWTANNPDSGSTLGDDPACGPGENGKVRLYAHDTRSPVGISYWEGNGGDASWGTAIEYTTDGEGPFDCSVNVRFSRYYYFYTGFLVIAYWKSTYPSNEIYVGIDKLYDATVETYTDANSSASSTSGGVTTTTRTSTRTTTTVYVDYVP